MAFSNATDARTKLTNPLTDEDSEILYANNDLLDSTTIFYKNSAKTILASSGNYAVVTNFKTYFVTLGSDGKIVNGSKAEVMPTGSDTSWVEDRLKDGDTNLVSNQLSLGGTSLSLDGSLLLTDAVWASRPYTGSKAWIIDTGEISTSAITNIDLSAMKGYDLRLVTGEYVGGKFIGNDSAVNTTSAIIHLAPDPARVDKIGNKKYFFRPDYWIPSQTFNAPSYFRRMPNIQPLIDNRGIAKTWVDMATPLMDVVERGSHSPRTSKRMDKGVTESTDINTQWSYNQIIPREKKLWFDNDGAFRIAVSTAWGVSFETVDLSELWQHRTVALLLAHGVAPADWSTWTYSGGGYTYTYDQANPYQWTTAWGSGIAQTDKSLPSQFVGYFVENQPFNAIHFEYDFEHLSPALFIEEAGDVWRRCLNSAIAIVEYLKSQNEPLYVNWVYPKFSNYGNGIYQSRYVGAAGFGWQSMESGNTITGTMLYSDYHDYFINGTKAYTACGLYYPWFKGALQHYRYHYVSNYQFKMNDEFQVYSIVHNTDITRKMLTEILGATHDKRVLPYMWNKQEPIDGSDFGFQRKTIRLNGLLKFGDRNRLEVCPSQMYNFGVWGMCYCDGLFAWYQSTIGEEVTDCRYDQDVNGMSDDNADAKWGDTTGVGKMSLDWPYVGYLHAKQNEDIISANSVWKTPNYKIDSTTWTSGTDDYPVSLYNQQRPIASYKLSADGTEALVWVYYGFNNGYTKVTHTFRLPDKANYQFTVDTWGNYTTVLRLSGL